MFKKRIVQMIFFWCCVLKIQAQPWVVVDSLKWLDCKKYEQLISADSVYFKISCPSYLKMEVNPEDLYPISFYDASKFDSIKFDLILTAEIPRKRFKTSKEEVQQRVSDYKIEFGELTTEEISIKNKNYDSYSVFVNAQKAGFSEYIVYINYGKKDKYNFEFSLLLHGNRKATEFELTTFQNIVSSFSFVREL